MPDAAFFDFSVVFALVTGTCAGLLSLLSWEVFRRSPLGRSLFVLSVAMSGFILHHVLLLGFQSYTTVLRAVESVAYTGLAVFVLVMVLSQRRVRRNAERGQL